MLLVKLKERCKVLNFWWLFKKTGTDARHIFTSRAFSRALCHSLHDALSSDWLFGVTVFVLIGCNDVLVHSLTS